MACLAALSAQAQQIIPLQGQWQVTDSTRLHATVTLPGTIDEAALTPENQNRTVTANLSRLHPYVGRATYSRQIDIPTYYKNQKLTLFLERTKDCTVLIDGKPVGRTTNLQQPVEFDLTGLQGSHRLSLVVDNRDDTVLPEIRGSHAWTDATQTNWNGIVGRLEIRVQPSIYISDMRVTPHVATRSADVTITLGNTTGKKIKGVLTLNGKKYKVGNTATVTLPLELGADAQLWSEYNPKCYMATAVLASGKDRDTRSVKFGLREYGQMGTNVAVNGQPVFLRGTHDGCVFPDTGYPPMTVGPWLHYFSRLKDYGINHMRCHSWTPPEAAFEAADSMGIYIQAELPCWGTLKAENQALLDYLARDGELSLKYYGNHPSLMSLALGNELWGEPKVMQSLVDKLRAAGPGHLYVYGSNNNLGMNGYQGGDYYVTCRTSYDADSTYATHTRASFSFADAYKGGIANNRRPATDWNYSGAIRNVPVPVISHESGQYEIYPRYGQIAQYRGVLRPWNLEVFRLRLEKNGLSGQAQAFSHATEQFALRLYKFDIEACLRTPGFGGYQMLDIKDYPGQGSALVGILDAYLNDKAANSRQLFSQFNTDMVPMAEVSRFCWNNDESLTGNMVIANYSPKEVTSYLTVTLTCDGKTVGRISRKATARQGVTAQGGFSFPLEAIGEARKVMLGIDFGGHHNEYEMWVYPAQKQLPALPAVTTVDEAVRLAQRGQRVLFVPTDIEDQSVGPLYTTDYWNYAMFKTISENNHREVSPGTMGMMMDPRHPLFRLFPTDGFSNSQWWSIAHFSRPLILNSLPKDYLPIVQTIDNVERNHKLGVLMEFRLGKGRILVSTTCLDSLKAYPEGRQYLVALYQYLQSPDFNPATTLTPESFRLLFSVRKEAENIRGVKNLTDYKKKD